MPSKYAAGSISNQAPAASLIELPGLGEFRPRTVFGRVAVQDRISEVDDILCQLNGGGSRVARSAGLFREYLKAPTARNKERLREAYEAVPRHLRIYCGSMDSKHYPIKRVLNE